MYYLVFLHSGRTTVRAIFALDQRIWNAGFSVAADAAVAVTRTAVQTAAEASGQQRRLARTPRIGLSRFADATFESGRRVFAPFQIFRRRMLPLGGTPFQVRLLALASFLAQLQDQLPGMVRDDRVVVLQDDAFQLERPFPLLFQVPGLTRNASKRIRRMKKLV
jgi:hypothetical protein